MRNQGWNKKFRWTIVNQAILQLVTHLLTRAVLFFYNFSKLVATGLLSDVYAQINGEYAIF